MRLNIYTKIAQQFNSSLAKLIDSVQSHLFNDVLLFRNVDEFKKYEQIQNKIKTLSCPPLFTFSPHTTGRDSFRVLRVCLNSLA